MPGHQGGQLLKREPFFLDILVPIIDLADAWKDVPKASLGNVEGKLPGRLKTERFADVMQNPPTRTRGSIQLCFQLSEGNKGSVAIEHEVPSRIWRSTTARAAPDSGRIKSCLTLFRAAGRVRTPSVIFTPRQLRRFAATGSSKEKKRMSRPNAPLAVAC